MLVNEKKDIKSMGTRQRDLSEFMNFFEWGVHMALAFIVILLLGIMTDVWGNLAKAQDDAETIEEAIVRLIGIHEAEPTSHTGDGEAIDVHRKNDVIDHPQGSILGDKFTNREFVVSPSFESTDQGYSKSTSGIYWSLAGLRFETGNTINTVKYIRASGQYSPAYFNLVRATTFQFGATMIDTANYTAYGMAGNSMALEVACGIGFKFVDGSLYAVQTWTDSIGDPQEETHLITGVTLTSPHLYRVQLTDAGEILFYVDGDLLHTMTAESTTDVGLSLFEFYIKNTTGANRRAHFSAPYLSLGA